ncbi:uncharacterized protein Z520_01447 [Fonsecaea multimorphosa CBS 102226]|uniref:Major facilitator superfamily (MFS) profile domain-containing protein n=1 Tax=Fonsecaea multimorphosa CBS 102226 TaxID=1442371 RepID=A0A0D2J0U7_9EURO|nr:uncharacterized protein Z520_01447 [Fonsecaea multimorphosa CBS 102226]KIY02982.1 hypothetical protein Z520_01447 [Fonsecaea multimorphosa CBS 102226]
MSDSRVIAEIGAQTDLPPGTVLLHDLQKSSTEIVLHPIPTADPNDPLNWSRWRKALNFALANVFVLFTFVLLDISSVAYGSYTVELHITYSTFTVASAVGFTGLAVGCVLFIPFVHKYGRRPIYLLSCAVQFASAVWYAKMNSRGEMIAVSLLSGLGGALSETLVQVTIADLFFVHQHATMSAIFLLVQAAGSFLGPVAAGYVVVAQGWRWIWWWCAIFLGANFFLVGAFFEESKYIPQIAGHPPTATDLTEVSATDKADKNGLILVEQDDGHMRYIDMKPRSYRQRMALFTKTDASVTHHFYQPFVILCTFPAVAYTALTYGCLVAWYAVIVSVVASTIIYPPYNFSASSLGLMSIAPFVGCALGSILGGPLNDRLISWLARRNRGVFEPEMRLYMSVPAAVLNVGGILIVGLGLAHGLAWPALAIGFGVFGFGFVIIGDAALAYVTDCYQDIVGDALVAVVFVRNGLSLVIMFSLSPWRSALGLQNLFVSLAMIALAIFLVPIPLMIWGKKARVKTAERYRNLSNRQSSRRTVS